MTDYFVYVDWTCEPIPRPFYVGKGVGGRLSHNRRNAHHKYVRQNLGSRREIVLMTSVEQAAFDHEVYLIAKLGTFNPDSNMSLVDIRCNRTIGGANPPLSRATKRKISQATKGVKKLPQHQIELLREIHTGRKRSDETRKKLSDVHQGKKYSEEWKQARREASRRRGKKLGVKNS